MAVTVRIPTLLRAHVGGRPSVDGNGDTVRDLVEDLDRRYPGIKGRLVGEDGGLHRFVNVYLNDEDVRYLGSLETPLHDGDTVSILPAVSGGCPASEDAEGRRGGGIRLSFRPGFG